MPAYEVSNHASPGAESRHNLTYWRYGDYAGIGPGAHGRLTRGLDQARHRHRTQAGRPGSTSSNAMAMACSIRSMLGYDEQADELLLMGLRLTEGVDLARWQQLSGRDPRPEARRVSART
jgi:coproporphyrinogen III oxidase-like Fe-S oxidoreductase